MDLAKIIRIVAVLVAVVAGLGVAIPSGAVIIAVLGAVAGYFVEEDRRTTVMITAVTLAMVNGALGSVPAIGGYLDGVLGSLSALYNAGACTVIVVALIERVKP